MYSWVLLYLNHLVKWVLNLWTLCSVCLGLTGRVKNREPNGDVYISIIILSQRIQQILVVLLDEWTNIDHGLHS